MESVTMQEDMRKTAIIHPHLTKLRNSQYGRLHELQQRERQIDLVTSPVRTRIRLGNLLHQFGWHFVAQRARQAQAHVILYGLPLKGKQRDA